MMCKKNLKLFLFGIFTRFVLFKTISCYEMRIPHFLDEGNSLELIPNVADAAAKRQTDDDNRADKAQRNQNTSRTPCYITEWISGWVGYVVPLDSGAQCIGIQIYELYAAHCNRCCTSGIEKLI